MVDSASKSFQSELDRPSLFRTRDHMKDVLKLINDLPVRVAAVASSAENEFLAAYRVHMLSIQSELRDLNDQVKKAEEQLKSDTKVESLEKEVSWFKEEKIRLQKNSDCMHQDMHAMNMKLNELREQKKFLSDQLKTVMKRSRVLESELQMSGYEGTVHSSVHSVGSHSQSQSHSVNEYIAINDRSLSPPKSTTKSLKVSRSANFLPGNLRGVNPVEKTLAKSHSLSNTQKSSKTRTGDGKIKSKSNRFKHGGGFDALVDPPLKPVDSLVSADPARSLNALKSKRQDSEVQLENALRESFRGIVARKISFAAQNSLSRVDNCMPHNDLEMQLLDDSTISGPGGVTGLGLEHFTDIDRLDAVVRYLSNPVEFEKVITAMCDMN